jgi:hypothetical protein
LSQIPKPSLGKIVVASVLKLESAPWLWLSSSLRQPD